MRIAFISVENFNNYKKIIIQFTSSHYLLYFPNYTGKQVRSLNRIHKTETTSIKTVASERV